MITPTSCSAVCRQYIDSPTASRGQLLEGPGRPLLPLRIDVQRAGSLSQELGGGEGSAGLLPRSSMQQVDDAGSSGRPAGASPLFSPPNSPRRRQTTFGATLDFVETLCQASSSLTAFQRARACCRCVHTCRASGVCGLLFASSAADCPLSLH
jgi:hypothetical protein